MLEKIYHSIAYRLTIDRATLQFKTRSEIFSDFLVNYSPMKLCFRLCISYNKQMVLSTNHQLDVY